MSLRSDLDLRKPDMKNALKDFLNRLGLLRPLRQIRKRFALRKYSSVDQWILERSGLRIRYSTRDWYSKSWFFPRYDGEKIHEPVATDVFIQHIGTNGNVLDIGSHLGYFTCLSGMLAAQGNIHAFEIDPNCIALIKENVRLNDLQNVHVVNAAVSDHNGTETIPLLDTPNPRLSIRSTDIHYAEVSAVRVDDYLSENNLPTPDFVKIDVEGAEGKVLAGMSRTLDSPGLTILIELHVETLAENFDTDYRDLLSLLANKGFQMSHIASHRTSSSTFDAVDVQSRLSGNTMVLCTKQAGR